MYSAWNHLDMLAYVGVGSFRNGCSNNLGFGKVYWCHFLECASFCGFGNVHGHIYCRVSSPFQVEYCGKVGGPKLVGGR